MAKMNTDDTIPNVVNSEEPVSEESKTKKPRRWLLILLGIVVIFIGGGLGGYLGYRASLQDRLNAEQSQVVMTATEQFQMGVTELAAGKYEMARKRFEFVISLDPNFPGVQEKLAESMLKMAQVLTPTPMPSPTVSPTPDLRGEQELYGQIQQHLANKEWMAAIEEIDTLRKLNLEYQAVAVDGMYYIALRFLGIENILNQGQLEVGIYNLTLAERFAPLDVDAINYRNWARQYLTAASFWGLDWAQVVSYFEQIYPSLPNLRDASGMTATERYRLASIKYGDQLMSEEKYCDAQLQYEHAWQLSQDTALDAKAQEARDKCANPPGQPVDQPATPTITPTLGTTTPTEVTPTEVTPTEVTPEPPTPEPTPSSGG